MTAEHEEMERVAAGLDSRADDIFGDIDSGAIDRRDAKAKTVEAQALRHCAAVIRYQIECEA